MPAKRSGSFLHWLGGLLALTAAACAPTQNAPSTALRPQSYSIGFIEPSPQEDGKLSSHSSRVVEVYRQRCNVPPSHMRFYDPGALAVGIFEKNAHDFIDSRSAVHIHGLANRIEKLLAEEPDVKTLNASYESSRYAVYRDLYDALGKNEALRNEVLGSASADMPDAEVRARVVQFVDSHLDTPGGEFQRALQRYAQVTRRAVQAGLFIVVAVGNNQQRLEEGFPTGKPGAAFNFIAMSDWVFKVAASYDKRTPQRVDDDLLVNFSAHGNSRFKPDTATRGLDISTPDDTLAGTSFSAPILACTLDRAREILPTLTFEQAWRSVHQTAYNTPEPPEAEGSGMLDIQRFLSAVSNLVPRPSLMERITRPFLQ